MSPPATQTPMHNITVNGKPVTPEAVQFELERLIRFHADHGMPEAQIRAQLPALSRQAAGQAVGLLLLLEEADRLDIPVPDSEIDAQIRSLTDRLGGREAFDRALAARKTPLADFRAQLRRGRRVDKLIERITADAEDPTEEEIRAHFDAHRSEYVRAERVLAQHILITPDGDSETAKREALRKIRDIRARVVDRGADFSDEAAAHSMCPSGKQGGSLGWFSRGMMAPEFDSAAFSLRDGEVSGVIETKFGYHIIYKTAHEDPGEPDFDEVREKIRDFLRHSRRGEIMSAHVAELRAKARIEGMDDAK